MKILLTGPNSFSGKTILKQLINKGYDITTISRRPLEDDLSKRINCIYGDLTNIKRIDQSFDAAVHIAATSSQEGITSHHFIHDNIMATQNLIQLAKQSQIKKFIFLSTCSVYGQISQPILNENTPILNPCMYGASKLMCEAMLREQQTFQSIAIRLPAIIGRGAARHWLANTINQVKMGASITMYNPDAIFNNAIHISTLGLFIDKLLHAELPYHFDYINVASKEGLPIKTILEKILTSMKSDSKIKIGEAKKMPFSISYEYASSHYGFEPMHFSEALEKYLFEQCH